MSTTVTRIPDPAEPVPAIAWPTLALLIGALGAATASTLLAATGAWPYLLSIPVNAVCAYLLFTVSHDAAHHAASSDERVNKLLGRLATPFFAPHASFSVWRFIHMQHHRFTNHDDGRDPDAYTMAGPSWQRPLRWMTIDLHYLRFYLGHIAKRPRAEKRELAVQWLLVAAAAAAAIATGRALDLLLLVLLPQRLAVVWLAYAFDYLPHHGLHHKPGEDKLKTTRNRVGGERWASPLLLYQNYHLVHHLHPVVPFYRYLAVWRRNERAYLDGDPELTTLRGRPLTPQERAQLRELAEH